MNTCTITGNAGRDAELKYTQSGMAVCNFSVAEYKGENKDSVWWSIVCFGETAETVAPLVKKGWKITATGTVELDLWEKDGKTNARLKLLADAVGARPPKNAQGGSQVPAATNAQHRPATAAQAAPAARGAIGEDEDPFGDQ